MAIRPKRTCYLCRLGIADLYRGVRTKVPLVSNYTSFKESSGHAVTKILVLAEASVAKRYCPVDICADLKIKSVDLESFPRFILVNQMISKKY
jgi:hypothetical protein